MLTSPAISGSPARAVRHKRLFVGLAVPSPVARELLRQARACHPRPGSVHWIPVTNCHITLCYLGEVPSALVPLLAEQLRIVAMASATFELQLDNLSRFPDSRGHILAALPCPGESLPALQQRTLARLATLGLSTGSEPEQPFRPHITLARYRRKGHDPGDAHLWLDPVQVFTVEAIQLYQSVSLDQATIYHTLASATLRP